MRSAGRRTLAMVFTALALGASSVAFATPDEDYQRGLTAYHRGDVSTAIGALRPAAAAGHAPSQALLAFVYERAGEVDRAVPLYRDAAAQGLPDAQVRWAEMLLAGQGVAKDEKAAFEQFSKAAAQGHRHAVEVVATAWLKGQWGADERAEPAAARAAVQRAADGGHLPSAEALAAAYRSGRFGVDLDPAQASRWDTQVSAWRRQRAPAASAPTRTR